MKLQDKVCVVTGAASGIGKTIAMRFAREVPEPTTSKKQWRILYAERRRREFLLS